MKASQAGTDDHCVDLLRPAKAVSYTHLDVYKRQDYSRFRMLDTMTTGGLDEVIADHRNLLNAIERCDLAAFEPLVERHLYGGIRRLGSKLTGEYADYFEPEPEK